MCTHIYVFKFAKRNRGRGKNENAKDYYYIIQHKVQENT